MKLSLPHKLNKNTPLIVGFSGGADSCCLLNLLIEAGFKPILAHVNYNLRGADSKNDRQFAEKTARKFGLPLEVKEVARLPKGNLEEQCRLIRYTFF